MDTIAVLIRGSGFSTELAPFSTRTVCHLFGTSSVPHVESHSLTLRGETNACGSVAVDSDVLADARTCNDGSSCPGVRGSPTDDHPPPSYEISQCQMSSAPVFALVFLEPPADRGVVHTKQVADLIESVAVLAIRSGNCAALWSCRKSSPDRKRRVIAGAAAHLWLHDSTLRAVAKRVDREQAPRMEA